MAHIQNLPSSSSGYKIVLKMFNELQCTHEWTLGQQSVTFGSLERCDIQIPKVSGLQAGIELKLNGDVLLHALGNDCGSYVNDDEIPSGMSKDLHNGDDFWFGRSSRIIFRLEKSPEPYIESYRGKRSLRYEFMVVNGDLITGKAKFSNSPDIKREKVTFQIFQHGSEAVEQYNTLIDLEGDHIAQPCHVEVGQPPFIMFKKHLRDFDSWLAQLDTVSWHNGIVLKFFKNILEGLHYLYTEKTRGHGNLLSGILVTEDNRALFTKIPKDDIGYEATMRKDVLDLARIIVKISKAHLKSEDGKVPYKVERFLKLLKDMLRAEPFSGENLYWVTSNPMCWDVEETIRFYYNMDDLCKRLDLQKQNISMVEQLRNFGLTRWQGMVPTGTPLHAILLKGQYKDEMSITLFTRNAIEHYKDNYYSLYNVYRNISDVEILEDLDRVFPTLCFDLFELLYRQVIQRELTLGSSEEFLNSAHSSSAPKYQRLR